MKTAKIEWWEYKKNKNQLRIQSLEQRLDTNRTMERAGNLEVLVEGAEKKISTRIISKQSRETYKTLLEVTSDLVLFAEALTPAFE